MNRIPTKLGALALAAVLTIAACGGGDDDDTADGGNDDGGSSPSAETVSIKIGMSQGSAVVLPLVIGVEQGIFEEHGIDAELVNVAPNTLVAALSSGSVDMIHQVPNFFAATQQAGQDVPIFCGGQQREVSSWVAPIDSDIPEADGEDFTATVEALAGKTMGLAALGGSQDATMQAMFELAGVDPGDVTLIATGVGASQVAALDSGQVDVLYAAPFVSNQLLTTGDYKEVFVTTEDGPEERRDAIFTAYGAPREWLEENTEAAGDFCAALADVYEFMEAEAPNGGLDDVLADEYELSPEVIEDVVGSDAIRFFDTGVECDSLDRALELSRQGGTLEDPVPTCDELAFEL
ncbi:MAG TPA: ABC transporter substrate-binding protein [Iamia sp.]|nr:ABC transporter substrate-binding protein [Iamia sp.]